MNFIYNKLKETDNLDVFALISAFSGAILNLLLFMEAISIDSPNAKNILYFIV